METERKTEEEVEKCCGGGCHNKDPHRTANKDSLTEQCGQKAVQLTAEELTDLLKRTQANFDNYRKQMQTYNEEVKKMAARDIILQLLPIIDNFELAMKSAGAKNESAKEFVHGMGLIHTQLMKVLEENNVVQMETAGKKFDPYYHEALMKVPADKDQNIIMEEFQKGYLMHSKVLRHAKVKVSAEKIIVQKNKSPDMEEE